jgi:hypothetical protein
MTEIRREDLRREHLREFWSIHAIAGYGEEATRERVWTSKRLVPFVGSNHPGTELTALDVRVPSLDEAGLRSLTAKIEHLEREVSPA